MLPKETAQTHETTKTNWVYFLLVLLIIEKIIQHIFVTLAFYFNWGDIASTVALSPTILMILGAIVAVLLVISAWGMITKKTWAVNLVIALALFDIIGEFVAQGRIAISMTVSFLVATLLLILAFAYRRHLHLMTFS
jgi:hypothetical protein